MTFDVDTDWLKVVHKDQLFNRDTSYTDFDEWLEKEGYGYVLRNFVSDDYVIADVACDKFKVTYAEIQKGGA